MVIFVEFPPRLIIAAFGPCVSEHLCYNCSNPKQLRTAMPNARNFSDPEKRQAMDLLRITTTSIPPARLQARPSLLAQKTAPPPKRDFVRKKFFFVRQTDNVRYYPNNYQQSDAISFYYNVDAAARFPSHLPDTLQLRPMAKG